METYKTEHGMIVTSNFVRDKAGDEICEEIVLSVESPKRFPRLHGRKISGVILDEFDAREIEERVTHDLYT